MIKTNSFQIRIFVMKDFGMRLVLLGILLIMSLSAYAQQRQTSYIDNAGSWYHVYDTNGKKITTLSSSAVRELIEWSEDIITMKSGGWCNKRNIVFLEIEIKLMK